MPCSLLICGVMVLVRTSAPRAPARAGNKPFGASFFFFNQTNFGLDFRLSDWTEISWWNQVEYYPGSVFT